MVDRRAVNQPLANITPLRKPGRSWWRRKVHESLMSLGYGGSKTTRRHLTRHLKQRTADSLLVWPKELRPRVAKITRIIAEELDWPNGFFIPQDPLWLVLFDSSYAMGAVAALMNIEDEFEYSCPSSMLEDPNAMFGEFVLAVKETDGRGLKE